MNTSLAPYSHALRAETRDFLANAADWQWFTTFTAARDVRDSTVHHAFTAWARYLARDVYRAHLRIGWVYAPQARGVLHVHALVAVAEHAAVDITAAELAAAWHEGTVDVQPVFDRVGAVDYMLSHTALAADDIRRGWNLNVACDRRGRCHRARCAIAPGSWSAT